MSIDGTGNFFFHPNKSNVIPLCPEVIQNSDGDKKNDSEQNASKRFIENFQREHPHLNVIVVEDGIASSAPHIRHLKENKLRYLISAKPGDHEYLFEKIENSGDTEYYEFKD